MTKRKDFKMSKLAINGGEKTVKAGTIKAWPPVDQTDEDMVLAALRGQKWSSFDGENCTALEEEFAKWNGNRYCITTNSGTAALHMGLVACGVGAGDHVLVTAYSWAASSFCILHHNAIPVFVDIDFDTINMDVDKIEAAITPRTKAIVAVHLNGVALNMEKVMEIAKKYNLKVIEDACQSHGAKYNGKKAGTFGDTAAFSFTQNKMLASGEGGLFVTDDPKKLGPARELFSQKFDPRHSAHEEYHASLGWKYRNNDIIAALGRSQLMKLDGYLQIQKDNAMAFQNKIKHLESKGLILPVEPEGHTNIWYEYVCRLDMDKLGWTGDPAVFRDAVLAAIQAEGAGAKYYQRWILPQKTIFQNKDAYGLGTPWSIDNSGDGVDYSPEQFPMALKHASTHFGMSLPLRPPNGTDTAELLAEAYCKVFENLDQIDPDKIAS
jgi:dTDP-4-amino-4,6-dideoxygalactose transaminase